MAEQLELFPKLEGEEQKFIEDTEWCFQFFNNEPIVFGWGSEGQKAAALMLQIQPIEGESLTFQQNGMVFKIFPRPISEETKIERKKQNYDESKNQETTSESSNS